MSDAELKLNNGFYYLTWCSLTLLFLYAINSYLYTDSLYYSSFGEQFTSDQIQRLLDINKSWKTVGYILIPVILIIRILYSTLCMFVGDLIQETRWGFKALFRIALKADAVFILAIVCNFYYYALLGNYKTLEDLSVNCLSLLNYTDRSLIPSWLTFTFNSINLFELFYILLLALFIRSAFKISYLKATIFTLLTYGIGNYLYVVGMTFLYLNFAST